MAGLWLIWFGLMVVLIASVTFQHRIESTVLRWRQRYERTTPRWLGMIRANDPEQNARLQVRGAVAVLALTLGIVTVAVVVRTVV